MRASGSNEALESLRWKKQGRPLLLGDKIYDMVQSYIRRVRKEGAEVSTQIILSLSFLSNEVKQQLFHSNRHRKQFQASTLDRI